MNGLLPAYLDTRDSLAQMGTTRVRSVDRELIVVLSRRNREAPRYEIWGPCLLRGGWDIIAPVVDEYGKPYLPPHIPWELVMGNLIAARNTGENAADRCAEHNQRIRAGLARDASNFRQEAASYYAEGIARGAYGDGRWSRKDIFRGFQQAMSGGW